MNAFLCICSWYFFSFRLFFSKLESFLFVTLLKTSSKEVILWRFCTNRLVSTQRKSWKRLWSFVLTSELFTLCVKMTVRWRLYICCWRLSVQKCIGEVFNSICTISDWLRVGAFVWAWQQNHTKKAILRGGFSITK